MWADPVVTRYIGGRPSSRSESWARLLRYRGHWSFLGFGYWAVEEKASGRFLGEVGFGDFKRDLEPSIDGVPEVGWALQPSAHGRGVGTEALRRVLEWGDRNLGAPRTVCLITPENQVSKHLAAKCGFREWVRTTYAGHPAVLYERPAPRLSPL